MLSAQEGKIEILTPTTTTMAHIASKMIEMMKNDAKKRSLNSKQETT